MAAARNRRRFGVGVASSGKFLLPVIGVPLLEDGLRFPKQHQCYPTFVKASLDCLANLSNGGCFRLYFIDVQQGCLL